jgi:putative ABC transport system permease protein
MARIQFRWPWRKRTDIGTEVDEEVRFHLDMRADELMKQGVSREEARRQALGEFGDVERARLALGRTDRATEGTKRRRMLAEEWWRDATLAVRSLRRAPSFTAVAVLTLGLGIGLSAVVFSVVNGVLLRPLAYPDAHRLVTLWQLDTQKGEREKPAPANFLDWRDRARSFTHLAAAIPYGYDYKGEGDPVNFSAFFLTKGFLENLGVRPVLGRAFTPEEYEPGAPKTVMLSEALWRTRFGADPGIIGQTLNLDGGPYQVVGVMPATLDYPERADVYTPRGFTDDDRTLRVQTYYDVVGRLMPGVTLAQAREEMARIAGELRREHPVANARVTVPVLPLLEHITGSVREALWVLLGAVALVLLIACVNIANLLLARGLARRSEIAVRAALGAGRGRIARQLLVESGVLAVAGGLTGIAVSALALPAVIQAATSAGLPRVESIVLDVRVLSAGFFAIALTMLIAGGVPAWILSRGSDGMIVRGGRGAGQPAGSKRTGRMLVAAEVAIALVLLVGASLLGQSLRRLLSEDLGFATDRRLLITTHIWDRYPDPAQRGAFMEQVIGRIEALPGVVAAMQIPLLKGRLFEATDRAEGKPVVVVGEVMANRFWPGEDPIGKRITSRFRGPPIVREVVGVVKDVRHTGHGETPKPEYYIPHAQNPFGSMTIVVHTSQDPAGILKPVQREVWALQGDLTFSGTESMEGLLAGTLAVRRVILMTIGLFAVLGAVLAAMGIYGVISLAVAQRTRELGVRMALGAAPSSLKGMVLREGMGLATVGIVLGGIGAIGLSRLLTSLLYGTAPTDPWSFAVAALSLGAVAALAAWIPARRATRVDPLVALRSD